MGIYYSVTVHILFSPFFPAAVVVCCSLKYLFLCKFMNTDQNPLCRFIHLLDSHTCRWNGIRLVFSGFFFRCRLKYNLFIFRRYKGIFNYCIQQENNTYDDVFFRSRKFYISHRTSTFSQYVFDIQVLFSIKKYNF